LFVNFYLVAVLRHFIVTLGELKSVELETEHSRRFLNVLILNCLPPYSLLQSHLHTRGSSILHLSLGVLPYVPINLADELFLPGIVEFIEPHHSNHDGCE
jgi:hypothetical protein